ncbi:Tpk1, partial [Symbiodinium sp. CCMP2456]
SRRAREKASKHYRSARRPITGYQTTPRLRPPGNNRLVPGVGNPRPQRSQRRRPPRLAQTPGCRATPGCPRRHRSRPRLLHQQSHHSGPLPHHQPPQHRCPDKLRLRWLRARSRRPRPRRKPRQPRMQTPGTAAATRGCRCREKRMRARSKCRLQPPPAQAATKLQLRQRQPRRQRRRPPREAVQTRRRHRAPRLSRCRR